MVRSYCPTPRQRQIPRLRQRQILSTQRPIWESLLVSVSVQCEYLHTILPTHFYRPQRSWAKVMFLQASVILSTGGGVSASVHAGIHTPLGADTPHEQTPREQTTPRSRDPPGSRHTPPPRTRYTPQD